MLEKTFTALVMGLEKSRLVLLLRKSSDYATADVLSNFKRVHAICKIWDINPSRSPLDAALFFVVLKLDRWLNLRGRAPKNEAVKDTIEDLHNYIDLAYAVQVEKDEAPPPPPKDTDTGVHRA